MVAELFSDLMRLSGCAEARLRFQILRQPIIKGDPYNRIGTPFVFALNLY